MITSPEYIPQDPSVAVQFETKEQQTEHKDAASIRQLIAEGNIHLPPDVLALIEDGNILDVRENEDASGKRVLVAYGNHMVVVVLRSSPLSEQHLLHAAEVIKLREENKHFESITVGSGMTTNPEALQNINRQIADYDRRINETVLAEERQKLAAERDVYIADAKKKINQQNIPPNVDKQTLDAVVESFLTAHKQDIPEYVRKALQDGRRIKLQER